MTDIEARLEQALKGDDPISRDPMFRVQILVRRERATARKRLLIAATIAPGIAILAWLGLSAMGPLAGAVAGWPVVTVVLLMALTGASYAGGSVALRSSIQRWRARASAALQKMPGFHPWY